ncbi:MAG: 50S ribosomal protein L10 [Chloroflexota bacterium]
MAISRERKKELIDQYVEMLSQSRGVILTSYRGLTVSQIESVRNKLRELNSPYHVVKNTLLRQALEQSGVSVPEQVLTGPLAVSFCYGELPATAKVLIDLAKNIDALQVTGGLMGQRVVDAEGVKALATLPPREVLLAQVVGGFQAPISGLVSALSGILRSFVYVLQARKEQLEGSGS